MNVLKLDYDFEYILLLICLAIFIYEFGRCSNETFKYK